MVAPFTPLSLAGYAVGLLCHTTGAPMLSAQATPLAMAEAHNQPQYLACAPRPMVAAPQTRYAVRGFIQSAPVPTAKYAAAVVQTAAPAPATDDNDAIIVAAPDNEPSSGDDRVGVSAAGNTETPASLQPVRWGRSAERRASGGIESQELAMVTLINRERQIRGEDALAVDPLLTQVARAHSADMCARGYFDHYAPGPGPVTPMDRYVAALSRRPDYAMVGENIFYRSATDSENAYAAEAHTAFMHSPGHRANILTAQYTRVGVGIYRNPSTGEFWVTQMFLSDSTSK